MKEQDIFDHFTKDLEITMPLVGTEVETHFVDEARRPISIPTSQEIFKTLAQRGWNIATTKGNLITELTKGDHWWNRSKILYELGRQNIELSAAPECHEQAWTQTCAHLDELYAAAKDCHAYPLFEPILHTDENLLVIPDERDASWLTLDGREALSLLARTASVQFTIDMPTPYHAIEILNGLARRRDELLKENPYPQEKLWRKYIATSKAGYRKNRYGVVRPDSIEHYVELLIKHDVVVNGKLVPFTEAEQKIDLFLRSVWWNFRLRRWNDHICIEVRTFARRTDKQGGRDLEELLKLIGECFPASSGGH